MRSKIVVPILVTSLALLAGRVGAEDVANPEYTGWSAFKVGASSTTETTTVSGGSTTTMKSTTKLVELTDAKAVVETTITMSVGGKDMDMPATKRDVPAKVAKVDPPADAPKTAPKTTEGDEEVAVGDQKIACHWIEVTTETEGMKSKSKTWSSKSVPGGLVMMESTTEFSGTVTTVKTALVSFSPGAA